MDLEREIIKEHSKVQANKIVDYVGDNPRRFQELVDLFLKGPYRITQRAAWPLSICVEHHPPLITPHLSRILKKASQPGADDAVKRNVTRLLQYTDIPLRLHGSVTSLCFGFLQNKQEPIAVRVFSMSVLARIAEVHPELKNELRLAIEEQLPYGSAGFLSRAKKVLKILQR